MSSKDSGDGQRQRCRRRVVHGHELDAAMALADMAGVGPDQHRPQEREDEELASTRLSLELRKVGIQSSSPCSSSSSTGGPHQQQQQPLVSGYGPRPRQILTQAEKEAKRLRRVLANRESARQTILRRQAIRDELARKVADLSSQNESMKKEKDTVMQEYLSHKEANKQLKQQVARTAKKAPAASTAVQVVAPPSQEQAAPEAVVVSSDHTAASPPSTPPQPSFLYTAAAPVPYVWGSWPPTAGYAGSLPPCAWYYHVVAHPPSGGGGAGTAEEDTDDDPCSLTLAIDGDKRSAPIAIGTSRATEKVVGGVATERGKAATAAEARKRRKEVTKIKHMHAAGRPDGEQW